MSSFVLLAVESVCSLGSMMNKWMTFRRWKGQSFLLPLTYILLPKESQ